MRLIVPARYALALATVAVVVGIVLLVRGGADGPAGWYQATVTVGAVVLLTWLVVAGLRRLLRRR